jgi:chromosome segregation protein
VRLLQIKLAGFKSFVDPTAIGTPGNLVGIVGPNGCGKSNVIDAVRWVLGESKASALRGESMQDVIFNGAGDRKPVGRASVELHFDNSQGRIGGQWGQYAELSIKRILTRDGDSTYYINNIPVRRRDIHDPVSRYRPRPAGVRDHRAGDDLPGNRGQARRAAHLSRGSGRRLQIQGAAQGNRRPHCRHPRKSFARRDIRAELGNQLARLEAQAKVATEYRELEGRLKQTQHMLWFSKQQDAVRARDRHTAEIANLTVALEALQADVRAAESKQESLRADHYSAGDALHEKQGGFYEANAEVTRLEQQLAFARENENRLSQQAALLTEQLGALRGQETTLAADRIAAEQALEAALVAKETAAADERAANDALPALEEAVSRETNAADELQRQIAQLEQAIRVAETKRENLARLLTQFAERRERLENELQALAAPVTEQLRDLEEQLALESNELVTKEAASMRCATASRRCRISNEPQAKRRSRPAASLPTSKHARRRWRHCRPRLGKARITASGWSKNR